MNDIKLNIAVLLFWGGTLFTLYLYLNKVKKFLKAVGILTDTISNSFDVSELESVKEEATALYNENKIISGSKVLTQKIQEYADCKIEGVKTIQEFEKETQKTS